MLEVYAWSSMSALRFPPNSICYTSRSATVCTGTPIWSKIGYLYRCFSVQLSRIPTSSSGGRKLVCSRNIRLDVLLDWVKTRSQSDQISWVGTLKGYRHPPPQRSLSVTILIYFLRIPTRPSVCIDWLNSTSTKSSRDTVQLACSRALVPGSVFISF